jgi:methyltransferase family protein
MRNVDGSAGDVDYGKVGKGYSRYRQAEPRIAAFINSLLGNAVKVINIGAGAGSYEPMDRQVVAIEPSASMRSQRPSHLSNAIDAVAERIPFPDLHFDAAMATFTVHKWSNLHLGLSEVRRVTRGPILIMTCDPNELDRFWLNAYAPEVIATEARRYPSIDSITAALGGHNLIRSVPIPLNCKDGFNEAYYGRPELLLEADARSACSAWSFVDPVAVERFMFHLRRDLDNGTWDEAYGYLRTEPEFAGSLKLIISTRDKQER